MWDFEGTSLGVRSQECQGRRLGMGRVCKCGRPSGTRKLCDFCALTGMKRARTTFRKRFFATSRSQAIKEKEEYESISGMRVLWKSA